MAFGHGRQICEPTLLEVCTRSVAVAGSIYHQCRRPSVHIVIGWHVWIRICVVCVCCARDDHYSIVALRCAINTYVVVDDDDNTDHVGVGQSQNDRISQSVVVLNARARLIPESCVLRTAHVYRNYYWDARRRMRRDVMLKWHSREQWRIGCRLREKFFYRCLHAYQLFAAVAALQLGPMLLGSLYCVSIFNSSRHSATPEEAKMRQHIIIYTRRSEKKHWIAKRWRFDDGLSGFRAVLLVWCVLREVMEAFASNCIRGGCGWVCIQEQLCSFGTPARDVVEWVQDAVHNCNAKPSILLGPMLKDMRCGNKRTSVFESYGSCFHQPAKTTWFLCLYSHTFAITINVLRNNNTINTNLCLMTAYRNSFICQSYQDIHEILFKSRVTYSAPRITNIDITSTPFIVSKHTIIQTW